MLAHWNNNPLVGRSIHSGTFSWYRVNQSLCLLHKFWVLNRGTANSNVMGWQLLHHRCGRMKIQTSILIINVSLQRFVFLLRI